MHSTFDQLLNAFWLRPETALWRELDIAAMKNFHFESPSLDLGCGDGIFSFIRAGGCFSQEFDAFHSVSDLNKFFENVDVFDSFEPKVMPTLTREPRYKIDCAFDQKEKLLNKARTLKLYKKYVLGNANKPLPFPNASFRSLFSNIVYWLDDPAAVIEEIARVLKPGGQACLMLPNTTFKDFSLFNQLYVKTGDPDWSFLAKLDRGRFEDNIRQAKAAESWESLFSSAGLHVKMHKQHLSKTIIQVWDIGLRPLFPVLRKMADSLKPNHLGAIKSEWISTIKSFLEPLSRMDDRLRQGKDPAFHCYILEK